MTDYVSDITRHSMGRASRSSGSALQGHPYYRLLGMYLEHFLPRSPTASRAGEAGGSSRQFGGQAGYNQSGCVYKGKRDGDKHFLTFSRPLSLIHSLARARTHTHTHKHTHAHTHARTHTRTHAHAFKHAHTHTVVWLLFHFGADGSESQPQLGCLLLSILVEFWLTDVAEPLPPETSYRAGPQILAMGPGAGGLQLAGGGAGAGPSTPSVPSGNLTQLQPATAKAVAPPAIR